MFEIMRRMFLKYLNEYARARVYVCVSYFVYKVPCMNYDHKNHKCKSYSINIHVLATFHFYLFRFLFLSFPLSFS